jgi:hypothetical protein
MDARCAFEIGLGGPGVDGDGQALDDLLRVLTSTISFINVLPARPLSAWRMGVKRLT